jgi:TRAP-type C4-dicarboxylate transport system permease small subunit
MNYLRRLHTERPVLFFVLLAVAFWVGFQVVLTVLSLILGPLGLPAWAPLVVVLIALVVIARRQQRSR